MINSPKTFMIGVGAHGGTLHGGLRASMDLPFPKIPGVSEDTIQEAIEQEFECNRCGHCCKGDGLVEIGTAEADRIAEFLGLGRRAFIAKYARQAGPGRYWLTDQDNPEKWCIFLFLADDGKYGCRINAVKPDQCGVFPARWRNEDSFRTCSGLRTLMRALRERARA